LLALGVGQKPIVMPHYPHMLTEDSAVWTKFLQNLDVEILEVWYDVHVGSGVLLPVGSDDLDKRIAQGVTRKRIDVVCRLESAVWVVELKPIGSMTALGQALAYRGLFVREYETIRNTLPIVICGEVDPDLIDDYDEAGVGLIVLE